jgi:hypothetical protein
MKYNFMGKFHTCTYKIYLCLFKNISVITENPITVCVYDTQILAYGLVRSYKNTDLVCMQNNNHNTCFYA